MSVTGWSNTDKAQRQQNTKFSGRDIALSTTNGIWKTSWTTAKRSSRTIGDLLVESLIRQQPLLPNKARKQEQAIDYMADQVELYPART